MSIFRSLFGKKNRSSEVFSLVDIARGLGVSVGEGTRITGMPNFGSEPFLVSIGDNCTISNDVQFLTHDGATWVCPDERGQNMTKFGRVRVENGCFIGCHSILLPGVVVGAGSAIGAGSVVTKSIPAGEVWAGNPAHFITMVSDYRKKLVAANATSEQKELAEMVFVRRKSESLAARKESVR